MKTIITKEYELSDEEFQALEKTKEVFDSLSRKGFEDDFCDVENIYLDTVIRAIEVVLANNGEDWRWE